MAGHDLDAVPIDLAKQVRHRATELGTARQLLGEQHLATGTAGGLIDA